ncbi:membrane protein [Arthrobacter phage Noely]|uniref:Membrane protein n=1 Tax=Arthrobacter phage Noely TaxID=2419964 RepID=A0A3G2KAE9_9CAUD|nr:membrane protein [Arthrobacter phage Noely]AYN55956.1 membrane protein [Arthrobacter phage Noely]
MNIKPTDKMAAAGTGGAAALLLQWGARQAGLDLPPDVAAAFVLVAAFVAGWLRTEGGRREGRHRG